MAQYFNETQWNMRIQKPDWYIPIWSEVKALQANIKNYSEPERKKIKKEIYDFFQKNIKTKKICLGATGPNWDKQRKPIDMIIIHHTSHPSGITWQRLNAIHLIRLYAAYYSNPTEKSEKFIKGKPIYSHHFRKDGTQVFYAYHWLVRRNGKAERLLHDNETGWQAGDWEVNCKSIAICLDGDFEEKKTPKPMLKAIIKIINTYYPHILPQNILGHHEINPKTTCPGKLFMKKWKQSILKNLKNE